MESFKVEATGYIYLDYPPFLRGETTLVISVCFPAHKAEKQLTFSLQVRFRLARESKGMFPTEHRPLMRITPQESGEGL